MDDWWVELESWQLAAEPVNGIDDGICTLRIEFVAKGLVVVKVILRAMGEETIFTSDWITTLVNELGVGVMEIVPEAILNPDLDICKETDLTETSIKHYTITLES